MIAALSVQVYFDEHTILHAAKLIGGGTREDILEDCRIESILIAGQWTQTYNKYAQAITINVHFEDGSRYANDFLHIER